MPAPSLWPLLLSRTDHTSGSTPGRCGYRSCKQLRDNEVSGIWYKKREGVQAPRGLFPIVFIVAFPDEGCTAEIGPERGPLKCGVHDRGLMGQ